jgi:Nitrate and nitrite sensing
MSIQRAVLFAALSSPPKIFAPGQLTMLTQAGQSQAADQSGFNASANQPEQEIFASTVSGTPQSAAAFQEQLAQQIAAQNPAAPLTAHGSGLNAQSWYTSQSAAIDATRTVTGQLTGQTTSRAGTLKSDATRSLLLTSIATLVLLLALLISAVLARPPRNQHAGPPEAITP